MTETIFKEHLCSVPLCHQNRSKSTIQIFAREVYLKGNEKADIFVYLQGGPGFASPRTISNFPAFKILLKKYRLVLLDQRGTGRSSKIGPETTEGETPEALAKYFSNFRADNIVEDLEYLREKVFKVKKWFLLAQSYGGFITFTYLSYYPHSIKGAIICGGVPPLTCQSVHKIYDHLTDFIIQRNKEFYRRYPQDKKTVKKIIQILQTESFQLPDTGKFTPTRFLDLGMLLGSTNGIESLHWALEDPFVDLRQNRVSYWFAKTIAERASFETNPIYAVLHESIYCDAMPSMWAADHHLKNKSEFSLQNNSILFYGETIRKAMFQEYRMLRPYQKIAQILADKKDWGHLYNKAALSKNPVPVEAIVYETDYYVNYQLSMETSKIVPNLKVWSHPNWQHDSLRVHGKEIIEKLLKQLEKRIHKNASH